ncbi:hypothetical protein ACHAXT_004975 [Thalassiosira profunda]
MASSNATKRILVLGGSGYVGQNVCNAAIQSGKWAVRSLNRSGAPSAGAAPDHLASSLSQVEWVAGDIFDASAREEAMSEVDAVVSCIGKFGSNSFMQRICGDATIEAVRTAKDKGVGKFGFVSSAQVYDGSAGLKLPPSAPMHGYYQGKFRAEKELLQSFPKHVILRPGFIYGPRSVGGHTLPLQLVGGPLSFVGTSLGPISSLIQSVPFAGVELSSMVPVESVGRAMISSLDKLKDGEDGVILDVEAIRQF